MKIVWGSLGTSILLVPTVAISAVACSSEKNPIKKPTITISAQPKNEIIFLNQPENLPTLSVNATTSDSSVKLAYKWYENASNSTTGGTAISGATNSTYTIPQSDATKTGTKYFYVVISAVVNNNILNSEISNISSITITNDVPAIVVQNEPQSQEAIIGQAQNLPTFSVVASAGNLNEKLTYQWYYNTTDSTSNGTIIDGATKPSYTTTTTDASSATTKYFYVKIDGSINGVPLSPIVSKTASLTIKAKPSVNINASTMTQTVYVNQTTSLPSFSVNVTPITGATFTYQWYKSGSNSASGGTAIQDATSPAYMISANDIGSDATIKYFYVTVSGTINGITLDSVTSGVFSLNVKMLPTIAIKTPPTPQTVVMNQTSAFPTLSVVATPIENATFTYQWYSSATDSNSGGTIIEGATKAKYITTKTDIGTTVDSKKYFYVIVGGSIGDIKLTSVTSSAVSLTTKANSAITISTQPTAEQVVAKDASVTLTAAATTTSSSELSYQWQKSNKVSTDQVWTNIEGANSSTYKFNATDEPGAITYYRVIVSEAITTATVTSNEAKVSVRICRWCNRSHNCFKYMIIKSN